jgi:hypothetical protein
MAAGRLRSRQMRRRLGRADGRARSPDGVVTSEQETVGRTPHTSTVATEHAEHAEHEGHWVPVAVAAERLGISARGVRQRAQRGTLPRRVGPDGTHLFLVPPPVVPPLVHAPAPGEGTDSRPEEQERSLARLTDEVVALREQRENLLHKIEAITRQAGQIEGQRALVTEIFQLRDQELSAELDSLRRELEDTRRERDEAVGYSRRVTEEAEERERRERLRALEERATERVGERRSSWLDRLFPGLFSPRG